MKLGIAFFITFVLHAFAFYSFSFEFKSETKVARTFSKNIGVSKIRARIIKENSAQKPRTKTVKNDKAFHKRAAQKKQQQIVDNTKSSVSKGNNDKLTQYLSVVREVIVKNKFKSIVAKRLSLKGKVKLTFEITQDQTTENAIIRSLKILNSSKIPPLDQSAIETIKKVTSIPRIPVEVAMKTIPVELDIVYE